MVSRRTMQWLQRVDQTLEAPLNIVDGLMPWDGKVLMKMGGCACPT